MSLIRITDSTGNSVSVSDFKTFAKIDPLTPEDNTIRAFIGAAEEYAENYMKRSVMPQQWRLTLDYVQDNIELPRGPLSTLSSAVSNFSYYDSDNSTNSMPSTCYTVDPNTDWPRIYRTYNASWPTNIRSYEDSVVIEYWTGYADAASVPEDIKTWIRLRAAVYYENREAMMIGSGNFVTEMPKTFVDGLLDRHSVVKIT